MTSSTCPPFPSLRLRASLFALCIAPWAAAHAERAIDEHRSVDPKGSIELVDVAGAVELSAWDRPELQVSGTLGDQVERVDIATVEGHTSIHVVNRKSNPWYGRDATHLVVHVPTRSELSASLVSADLKISGVSGAVKLQTVSGDVDGEVGGDLRVNTVSGNVRLNARAARTVEVKTISGDIELGGGGAETVVTTVSGDEKLELGAVTRGRIRSVSGDLSVRLSLAAEGELEVESISGVVAVDFHGSPAAQFDVQSFSGEIDNCFGPKPVESRYGPGSRLEFKNEDGRGRVRISSKSGNVHLCAK
jgi:hypothetical protein